MKQLPLITRNDFDRVWIYNTDDQLTVGQVLHYARSLRLQLPDHKYCFLLCEQRTNFIIGFLAALCSGQTVLLPPNRSPEVLQSLANDYSDSYCLTDAETTACVNTNQSGLVRYSYAAAIKSSITEVPLIDSSHLACVVFTSGSSGKPTANEKLWGDLVQGTKLQQIRFATDEKDFLVATVPSQHMYGLEMTVLLPMLSTASVYGGMPFFPEDIRRVLVLSGKPATLVTTPFHLRVCVQAGLHWPALRQIFSATAPLSQEDAVLAEMALDTKLKEIYGSTESGAIASRNTAKEQEWSLYDNVRLFADDDNMSVIASHLPHRPKLTDRIDLVDDMHFLMYGRLSDMIKIAGKRASLADLNLKLNLIPGVEDGVFLHAETPSKGVSRLYAVVVAPELSAADLIKKLGRQIDPVFLPRQVFKVDTLPRNITGKLPREDTMDLLQKLISRR